jgi:hypothetical protein
VHGLDFAALRLLFADLAGLDFCFSEEEVWNVIHELQSDKAPGSDGFTGRFYQSAWPVIKHDILQEFNAFWSLDHHNFYLVNQACVVLLCKKADVVEVKDFCPIALIHSINKLITKALSIRLAPWIQHLVHPIQSAFIKGCTIHDNFRTMQATTKLLHDC